MRDRSRPLKVLLPIAILSLAGLLAWWLISARPEPEQSRRETPPPLVRVQTIVLDELRLDVTSQGTVRPRTESTLVPEVAGRVIEVADAFVDGGFFADGDLLVRIDAADYREAVTRAEALVAQARLRVERERAEGEVARREWEELGDTAGDAPPLTLRKPQLAEALASAEAAHAELERARRNLARTEIRAPFAGRVRSKQADLGQYVTPGQPLATVYAVDAAEVRLPLSDAELAYIDLPLDYRDRRTSGGPRVRLSARFAGRTHEWAGRIVRTEGEIDPRTRLIHAVARIDDPYGHGGPAERPPLAVGMYVEARIEGRLAHDVTRVPREALRAGDILLVIDDEQRLRFREVSVLRRLEHEVVVAGGLVDGELVCISPLEIATDGMRVRVAS